MSSITRLGKPPLLPSCPNRLLHSDGLNVLPRLLLPRLLLLMPGSPLAPQPHTRYRSINPHVPLLTQSGAPGIGDASKITEGEREKERGEREEREREREEREKRGRTRASESSLAFTMNDSYISAWRPVARWQATPKSDQRARALHARTGAWPASVAMYECQYFGGLATENSAWRELSALWRILFSA